MSFNEVKGLDDGDVNETLKLVSQEEQKFVFRSICGFLNFEVSLYLILRLISLLFCNLTTLLVQNPEWFFLHASGMVNDSSNSATQHSSIQVHKFVYCRSFTTVMISQYACTLHS